MKEKSRYLLTTFEMHITTRKKDGKVVSFTMVPKSEKEVNV